MYPKPPRSSALMDSGWSVGVERCAPRSAPGATTRRPTAMPMKRDVPVATPAGCQKSVERAVALRHYSTRANSDQQDLIRQMKSDRRRETALAMELVMEPGLAQREPGIGRPCDARLKYRRERSAHDAPWRSERAFAALAVRRAVPLLMAFAPRTCTISHGTTVRVPVQFAARLTRAAPHHQVECQ